jgi:RNA polymerase sigma-70 factor (sigma-E family)
VEASVGAAAVDVPSVTVGDFEHLYELHSEQALRFAVTLTGNVARGEDLAAAAMLKVYRRWRRGGIELFWPYLRTVIVNEFRSEFRRKRPTEDLLAGTDLLAATADPVAAFDELLTDRSTLLAALEQLPCMQRAAIALRHLEDLSESQTAELLGCPAGTVKSNVSRGLSSLRHLLQQETDHA